MAISKEQKAALAVVNTIKVGLTDAAVAAYDAAPGGISGLEWLTLATQAMHIGQNFLHLFVGMDRLEQRAVLDVLKQGRFSLRKNA